MDKVITGDGSYTLYNERIGEHYHSKHGAYAESKHVFIKSGLQYYLDERNENTINILEVGFGTGLNLLTTMEYADNKEINIHYVSIEAYPLSLDTLKTVRHDEYVNRKDWDFLISRYEEALEGEVASENLRLQISPVLLMDFDCSQRFDVVYFDAFSETHQPEMWSEEALSKVAQYVKKNGVFVTYAITGNLKRRLRNLGFKVEKTPGAPGKREMLRAVKL